MQIKSHDAFDATPITLHEKQADLQKVLDAIGTQAHAKLQGTNTSVSIDVDQKPYWEVIADLCDQQNLCPSIFEDGSIRLAWSGQNWVTQSPHQILGPYWVSVAGFDLSKTVNLFGTTVSQQQFSIRLRVVPEPKLPVKKIAALILTEAKDNAGNSLLPLMHHEIATSSVDQTGMYTLESHLTYPEHPGNKVSVLTGHFSVTLSPDVHRYQIDDVLGKPIVSNEIKGCPVQATVTTFGRNLFRVKLIGDRKNLSDIQWFSSELKLLDSKNQPLVHVYEIGNLADKRKSIKGESFILNEAFSPYGFNVKPSTDQKGPLNLKLVWDVPMSFKTVTIPVAFKDLLMP